MSELRFFPHMGFRPAVQVLQRDQYGDKLIWIVGDDSPLEGKVPVAPLDPYMGMGSEWVAEAVREPLAGGKAVPGITLAKTSHFPSATIFPWPSAPSGPDYPCHCIEVPPDPAPVPIPASAGLLLLGLCIIVAIKRRKSHAPATLS